MSASAPSWPPSAARGSPMCARSARNCARARTVAPACRSSRRSSAVKSLPPQSDALGAAFAPAEDSVSFDKSWRRLAARLVAPLFPRRRQGTVFIVGAGPGDPDLLTVKALKQIKRADVIVHDDLVSQDILDL